MSENPKKLMKMVNMTEKIFISSERRYYEIFRKDVNYDNVKSRRKPFKG